VSRLESWGDRCSLYNMPKHCEEDDESGNSFVLVYHCHSYQVFCVIGRNKCVTNFSTERKLNLYMSEVSSNKFPNSVRDIEPLKV
jgi:hypothetical protein